VNSAVYARAATVFCLAALTKVAPSFKRNIWRDKVQNAELGAFNYTLAFSGASDDVLKQTQAKGPSTPRKHCKINLHL
jgi:hypothetical protein